MTREAVSFAQMLARAKAHGPSCALTPLLSYLSRAGLVQTPPFACTLTIRALEKMGVKCPEVDAVLIGAALRFLKKH